MPEEKNKPDDVKDTVPKDDYNKVVEAQNSAKAELEKVQKELKELKEEEETKETKKEEDKVEEEKKAWKQKEKDMEKQIEDLKAKKKDTTKAPKGPVQDNPPAEAGKMISEEDIKTELDKHFPDAKVDPEKFASAISRLIHFKSPTTKQFSHDQLGKAISLQHDTDALAPRDMPKEAGRSKADILVRN